MRTGFPPIPRQGGTTAALQQLMEHLTIAGWEPASRVQTGEPRQTDTRETWVHPSGAVLTIGLVIPRPDPQEWR